MTTHVADIGRSREQQRWTKRNRERPTGRHVEESGREWQRAAESGRLEDMWKRAEESGRVGHKTSSIISLGKTRQFGTHRIMQKR